MRAINKLVAASFLLFTSLSWGEPVATDVVVTSQDLPIPLMAFSSKPPQVFRGDGVRHLCYEIYLSNYGSTAWTMRDIKVENDSGATILSVVDKGLNAVLTHSVVSSNNKNNSATELAPGESVLMYLWIDLDKDDLIPTRLQNKLRFTTPNDDKVFELNYPINVSQTKTVEIIPPVRGKNWVALTGPDNSSRHRRSKLLIDGVPRIAQRYAIDWVRIGESGKTFHGSRGKNANYYGYGAEVHAVANAVVVDVKDGIPENTPPADATKDGVAPAVSIAVPITMKTIVGNSVILNLGGGVYAMYAHLQPGSIRVRVGDKLKAGQLIALLGNSGNSGEPHLHFQLMDRASALYSDGVPYGLSHFKLTARISGPEGLTESPADLKISYLKKSEELRGEIPLENEVVDFDD